jgi:hypothetical protein
MSIDELKMKKTLDSPSMQESLKKQWLFSLLLLFIG